MEMSFGAELIAHAFQIFLRIAKIVVLFRVWRTVGGELSYIVGSILDVLDCWRVIDSLGVEWSKSRIRLCVRVRICLLGGYVARVG